MSNDKIFVGNVKTETHQGNNGPWEKIKIAIGPEDFKKLTANRNNQGWVNLLFSKSRAGKYYMEIDTWEPQKQEGFEQPKTSFDQPTQINQSFSPPPSEDLPF